MGRDGGLGAVPQTGSKVTALVRGPEAETLSAFGRLVDTANLLSFLKFKNLKNDILHKKEV